MTKEFMAKLICNRIVDTRKYRYYLRARVCEGSVKHAQSALGFGCCV